MSTTHLVYDTGTIVVPPGLGLTQIGPTLDVRKYSKIRVVAHEVPPGPLLGGILIDLQVKEGNVILPLALGIAPLAPPAVPSTAVFEVPGRELEIFVRDIPGGPPRKLRLFLFGLEL
jgi:hypothetical protein